MASGSSTARALEVATKQLEKLNNEIAQRSDAQQRILFLDITAVGAIGAFTINNYKARALALLIPLVSSMLGFLWLDHALTIHRIGRFVEGPVWTSLAKLTGHETPNWEGKSTVEGRQLMPRLAFVLPLSALLIGPSIATLIYLNPWVLPHDWLPALGWAVGVVSVISLMAVWAPFALQRGWGRSPLLMTDDVAP